MINSYMLSRITILCLLFCQIVSAQIRIPIGHLPVTTAVQGDDLLLMLTNPVTSSGAVRMISVNNLLGSASTIHILSNIVNNTYIPYTNYNGFLITNLNPTLKLGVGDFIVNSSGGGYIQLLATGNAFLSDNYGDYIAAYGGLNQIVGADAIELQAPVIIIDGLVNANQNIISNALEVKASLFTGSGAGLDAYNHTNRGVVSTNIGTLLNLPGYRTYRPPLNFFNTWGSPSYGGNAWAASTDLPGYTNILYTITNMVNAGYAKLGYGFQIDEIKDPLGYDSLGNIHWPSNSFPQGIKWLADLCHSFGMPFGLCIPMGTNAGVAGTGGGIRLDNIEQTATNIAAWGVDFVYIISDNGGFGEGQWAFEAYKRFITAYRSTGKNVRVMGGLNGDGGNQLRPWMVEQMGDGLLYPWDNYADNPSLPSSIYSAYDKVHEIFGGINGIGGQNVYPYTSFMGGCNGDVAGVIDFNMWNTKTALNAIYHGVMGIPSYYGGAEGTSAGKKNHTNEWMLSVQQDIGSWPATQIATNNGVQVLACRLGDWNSNRRAVVFVNRITNSTQTASITWSNLSIPNGSYSVRDVWNMTQFTSTTNELGVSLVKYQCGFYIIEPTTIATVVIPEMYLTNTQTGVTLSGAINQNKIGYLNNNYGTNGFVGGQNSTVGPIATNGFAFGTTMNVTGNRGIGLGGGLVGGTVSGADAVGLGNAPTASGSQSFALGNATASGAAAYAFGPQTHATANYSMAFGYKAKATAQDSFMFSSSVGSGDVFRTNSTASSFQVYATGGINLLGGITTANGFGVTNLPIFTNYIFFNTNVTQNQFTTAALTPNQTIYLHPGDYRNLTEIVLTNGVSIIGYGANIYMQSASGVLITATNFTAIKGIHLYGGQSATTWNTNPRSLPWPLTGFSVYPNLLIGGNTYFSNKSGMFINDGCGGVIEDVDVEGFPGYGIMTFNLLNTSAYRGKRVSWKGIRTYSNFLGFWPSSTTYDTSPTNTNSGTPAGDFTAHYHISSSIQSFNNTIGVNVGAGNINFSGSTITANWLGMLAEGSTGIVGHGLVSGINCNHNTHHMFAYNMDSGMSIHNNYFYSSISGAPGDLYFLNCRDLELTRCFFDASSSGANTVVITVTNTSISGYNRVHDNSYLGTNIQFRMASTVSTNYEYNNYSMTSPENHSSVGVFATGIYGPYIGDTTGSTPGAGVVGQVISSAIASGSAVSLSSGIAANVTSISLTAGDWDVSGNVNVVLSGNSASSSTHSAGISATSATLPTDGTQMTVLNNYSSSSGFAFGLPCKVFNISSTTTIYLIGYTTFSTGSSTAYGSITARRVR